MARKTRTRRVYVGRRRGGSRRSSKKIAVAPIVGAAVSAMNVWSFYKSDKAAGMTPSRSLIRMFTGYDTTTRTFTHPELPMATVAPIVAGAVVHKLAGKFGVNTALAGVPYFKL